MSYLRCLCDPSWTSTARAVLQWGGISNVVLTSAKLFLNRSQERGHWVRIWTVSWYENYNFSLFNHRSIFWRSGTLFPEGDKCEFFYHRRARLNAIRHNSTNIRRLSRRWLFVHEIKSDTSFVSFGVFLSS